MGLKIRGANRFSPRHAQQAVKQFGPLAQLLRQSRMHHRAAIKHHGDVRNRQNRRRMLLDDDGRQPLFTGDAADGAEQFLDDDGRQFIEKQKPPGSTRAPCSLTSPRPMRSNRFIARRWLAGEAVNRLAHTALARLIKQRRKGRAIRCVGIGLGLQAKPLLLLLITPPAFTRTA